MKRKKKKGLGDATTTIKTGVKTGISAGLSYGAGVLGLIASYVLLSKVPKSNIVILDKIVPGIAAMTLAYVIGSRVESKPIKMATIGLGIAGAADLIKKSVGDKWPSMLPALPSFSGLRGLGVPGYAAVNTGDYPPNYYKENTFQRVGTPPYALSGNEMLRGNEPLRGMGTIPYALSGGMGTAPYALSGVGN